MNCEAKQQILDESGSKRVSFLSWPFIKHRFFSELVVVFLVFDSLFGSSIFSFRVIPAHAGIQDGALGPPGFSPGVNAEGAIL